MIDISTWLIDKLSSVPHAEVLRGLTVREMERKLHYELGFSRKAAKRFLSQHKKRLLDG